MKRGESSDANKLVAQQFPADFELFGHPGAMAAFAFFLLADGFKGKTLEFMDVGQFAQLVESAPHKANAVYWTEILERIYWVAYLNLLKQARWQRGCVSSYGPDANFLSFAVCLRGMCESAVDAAYSLRQAPSALATNAEEITSALRGELTNRILLSKDLEDLLLHYTHARRLSKSEKAALDERYRALEPWQYRKALLLPQTDDAKLDRRYDELCGYAHPTAFGVDWLYTVTPQNRVRLSGASDKEMIETLRNTHREAIDLVIMLSMNSIIVNLKVLNWFPLPEVWCSKADAILTDGVPAWAEARPLLEKCAFRGPKGE